MKKNKSIIFGIIGIVVVALVLVMASPAPSLQLKGGVFLEKYKATPNAVLLDVRTPSEFAAGHIDTAVNIDFENQSFLTEIKKLDTTKTYFMYCRSGNRSGQAILIMKDNGFKNIYELQGGLVGNKGDVPLVIANVTQAPEYIVDTSDMVNGNALVANIQKSSLSKKEIDGLIQMREEEKLAHDVYVTLGNLWGLNVFSNIAQSEQTHTDAIQVLLTRYAIPDPVKNNAVGVFTSKTMQELYDSLILKGKQSRTDALIVGATIEDLDIYDLDVLKGETDKEDILITYSNLQKGSRNHMRAFVRALGGNYAPQYISQDDYAFIINSPQERGRQ